MDVGSVDSVWDEYRQTGSSDAKGRLTLQYAPLVKWVANRTGEGGGEEQIRRGLQGLQAAIDAHSNVPAEHFEHYAMSFISEAVTGDPYSWDAGWREAM